MPLTTPDLTSMTTASPVLVSISLNDFIQDAGIVSFLGYKTTDDGGEDSHLGLTAFFGDPIGVGLQTVSSSTSFIKSADLDFDTSAFAVSATIEGTATFNFSFRGETATPDQHIQFILKLRKWDGTTETEIASVTTKDYVDASPTETACVEMTVPKTQIKIGESLRVTMEIYSYRDDAISFFSVAFDPQNREFTHATAPTIGAGSTQFISNIPFKITELST